MVRADARHLPLADASVDCIITSPPYFALRSYQDDGEHYDGQIGSESTPKEWLAVMLDCTREMVRVLKPSGSLFVNLGDKYAGGAGDKGGSSADLGYSYRGGKSAAQNLHAKDIAYGFGHARPKSLIGLPWRYAIGCIDDLGLILRAEIVWSKTNGLPESVTDRVRRSHEQIFHFTKQPRYYSAVDEVREAHTESSMKSWPTIGPNFGGNLDARNDPVTLKGHRGSASGPNPLSKLPGSVWTIPSEPLIIPEAVRTRRNLPDHFAAFPTELARRCVLGWSPRAVCTACGEGRRPVVDASYRGWTDNGQRGRTVRTAEPGRALSHASGMRSLRDTTITGYACACPEPTAPSTPGIVLDPFGGTGTVALVARTLGRVGISVDLSGDYCRLAQWRIWESGDGAKARSRTNAERQGVLL